MGPSSDTTSLLTIGRLGERGGIEPKTLRYYDRVGLLRPAHRTPAGYRVYGDDALERLQFIRRAKMLGISLGDIKRILAVRDEGAAPCIHVQAMVDRRLEDIEAQLAHLARLRRDLRRFRTQLRDRLRAGQAKDAADCPCFDILASFKKERN